MQRAETFAALASAVSDLPERERVVVTLYYEEENTMKEIGRALLISESRVSQIHGRALRRLRLGLDMAGERAA
jgi:RNA polymerase sigma factor for flagellar operon FliA